VRFKLDENLPALAPRRLVDAGWDVDDVHDEGLASAVDAAIQAACDRERRILITLDTDFADTRRYNPARSPGVIVLRPANQSIRSILACLDDAIRALATERIDASLWVVEPGRVRIRDHPTGA
jgi:predicted nuclease of predicted toxin-antitoxin system